MAEKPLFDRVAFSPGEFATLFGKSQTWGYRQIYSGKVKAITQYGRILIPAAEVEAILKQAGIYDGIRVKLPKTKTKVQNIIPRLPSAWEGYLAARKGVPRAIGSSQVEVKTNQPGPAVSRQAALARLTGKREKPKAALKRKGAGQR
jgi:hypothetical protein